MSQNKELDVVKRKISALCAKTVENGCTEQEALAAADKIAELLSTFNLSMTDIELHQQECVLGNFETSKTRTGVWYCWRGIAKLCGVKLWRKVKSKSYEWEFFGLEQDVELAKYLCQLIETSMQTSMAAFRETSEWKDYTGHRRTLTANFYEGFGRRIKQRLFDLHEKNLEKEKEANAYHAENTIKISATDEAIVAGANATTGTALISVAKEKKIEEEFKKIGVKLRQTYSSDKKSYNSKAQGAGSKAANTVNLSRPVGGRTSKVMGYLT